MTMPPLPTDGWEERAEDLLRAYFQRERPERFPAVPIDSDSPRSGRSFRRGSPLSRGRLLLLGCLALLLGVWLWHGPMSASPRRGTGRWDPRIEARQQKPHDIPRPTAPR